MFEIYIKKTLLASIIPMTLILSGCSTGMYLSVDSSPQNANVVCKFDDGWTSIGHTPTTNHYIAFNQQEIAQGYADLPCYVQWVSGKKAKLEKERFEVRSETQSYTFFVNRPKGGDLSMDVKYDTNLKQMESTETTARIITGRQQ